jgi:tetratricopeptide (TPR) repeat protein
MISLIIALILGLSTYTVLIKAAELNAFWSVFFGLIAFFVVQILLGLYFRKKVNAVTNEIQRTLMEAQEKINRKLNMFQQRPVGSPQHMQKLLEKEQHESLRRAIELTKQLEPYYMWSLLLKKQISTMRMQFYYQLGEFDKVDELMPDILLMEPMALAMKIARLYKRDEPTEQIEKAFRAKIRKFKGDDGVILYSLLSWILLKRDEKEKALKILTEAKSNTDNDIIARNWEAVANNKFKSFSNSSLGDMWYSLKLETPKMVKAPKQKMKKRFR